MPPASPSSTATNITRLDRALRSGHYRYLIHGHTHTPRDETFAVSHHPLHPHFINPAALHRKPAPTVALLNTDTDELRFLPIP